MTPTQLAAVPACLDTEIYDSFAEAVRSAAIELESIANEMDEAEHYTPRERRQLAKFVANNRASLKSLE